MGNVDKCSGRIIPSSFETGIELKQNNSSSKNVSLSQCSVVWISLFINKDKLVNVWRENDSNRGLNSQLDIYWDNDT